MCLLKFYTETLSNNILRSEWNLCQQLNDLNPKLETKIDPYYQREHQDAWFNEKYQSRDLLRLISVHFEQNGRWIGETSSNLQDYFLCENDTLKLNKLMFGVNLSKKCTWTYGIMQHNKVGTSSMSYTSCQTTANYSISWSRLILVVIDGLSKDSS